MSDNKESPTIAGRSPVVVDVEAGKTYWWCACGRSSNQPFCDGSHKGSSFSPLVHIAEKDGKIAFCTCKQTSHPPLCDGSHKRID